MKSIITIVMVISLMSCKKEDNDYRNSFIGHYECHKTGTYFCGNTPTYYDSTVIVSITKNNDSLINILDAMLTIKPNGEFGGGLYADPKHHTIGGYIINDSLYLSTHEGSLGCFTKFTYTGKKME